MAATASKKTEDQTTIDPTNVNAPEGTSPEASQEGTTEQPQKAAIDWANFSLEVEDEEVIPEDAKGIAPAVAELPYRQFFTDNLTAVLTADPATGKYVQKSTYAPLGLHQSSSDTYAEARGVPKKVVKIGDVRSKVSGVFKSWQDAKDAPKERKMVKLMFADRPEGFTGNDKAFEALGPGVRVYLLKA